ncbi:MAG TPA: DNA repair protein RecN, partial [Firmicutes bacterium]|nr:DNA repair protein RecN [Bacillota bacterium]
LGTLLGERTSPDVVRAGQDRAIVEARFILPDKHPTLAMVHELGGEIDGNELILRREIIADGRTRVWVGGASVPVRTLRDIGDRLVDFHGQHEHQLLLRPSAHVELLDAFAENAERLAALSESARTLRQVRKRRSELVARKEELATRRETIEFERQELDEIDPQPDELVALETERNVLENVERLGNLLTGLTQLLSEAEDSVVSRLGSGRRWIQEAAEVDESLTDVLAQYEETEVYAQETATRLADRLATLEADPMRLEYVLTRISQLRRLVRRYGSIEEAIEHRRELQQAVDDDAEIDSRIVDIEVKILDEHKRFTQAIRTLTDARQSAANVMSREVTSSLGALGMDHARFEVQLTRTKADSVDPVESDAVEVDGQVYEASPTGAEEVEFLIAPNVGEPLRPLVRIASGGEISRTMLAIKSVISEHDPVTTMVFDEIDAGVSGRIAQAVGERMRELARKRQIVAITHLPQIAAFADEHIVVSKHEHAGRTITEANVITGEARTNALAALFGGAKVSETALEHARALLGERR